MVSPLDRFIAKVVVDQDTDCWNWVGARSNGYGLFGRGRAHRWFWFYIGMDIPAGRELDHLCRNPSCVNPAHLEPVTHAENVRRAKAAVTHCPRGHAYDEANTYRAPGTPANRLCRLCMAIHRRKYQASH